MAYKLKITIAINGASLTMTKQRSKLTNNKDIGNNVIHRKLHRRNCLGCRNLKEQVHEFAHIQLDDLTVIKTLGVGGFGRVELVRSLLYQHILYLYGRTLKGSRCIMQTNPFCLGENSQRQENVCFKTTQKTSHR